MSFFSELKRRNVIRMAGLYIVGAWLVIQVAETLLPAFDVPGWVLRGLILLLAIGFIPALVVSWVFELTPDGLKRESDLDSAPSIAPRTARRMDRMIILALLLALTWLGFDRLVLAPQRAAEQLALATEAAKAEALLTPGTPASADDAAVDPRSIAVLPFANMSGDAANEYFSDGISEEILNVLASSAALRVAARTSSFSFKGKALEVPEIARALNVRMVLEGSVRRQGDAIRVTARLIDAHSGVQLWSKTFDRKLVDIFAIQDEIAKAIGDALDVQLGDTREPGRNSVGTTNLEAYDLYLRGIALWQTRDGDKLWQAIDLFEQSTVADPNFAQGYAGQALAYSVVSSYSTRMPAAEALERSRDLAEQALALDPSSAEAFAALAQVASSEHRRSTAIALLTRAIALRPSFVTAYQWRGLQQMSSGDLAAGLADIERASALAPGDVVMMANKALMLRTLGRYAEAKAVCERALDIAPDFIGCLNFGALVALQLGEYEAARSMFDRLAAAHKPSAGAQGKELIEALTGVGDRRALALRYAALAVESSLDATSSNAIYDQDMPEILMLLGESELALGHFERSAMTSSSNAIFVVMMPAMDPIRCDARFVAVVRQLKTRDPHFAAACEKTANSSKP